MSAASWFCGGCTVAFDVELEMGPLVDVRVCAVECPSCGEPAVRLGDVLLGLEMERTGLWIESTVAEIDRVLRDRLPKSARGSLRRLSDDLRSRAQEAGRRMAPQVVLAGESSPAPSVSRPRPKQAKPAPAPAARGVPQRPRCSRCGAPLLEQADLCGFCEKGMPA